MDPNSSSNFMPAYQQRGRQHWDFARGSLPVPPPQYSHSNALPVPVPSGYPPPPIYHTPAPQHLQHAYYHHSITYANPNTYIYHDRAQFAGPYGPFSGGQIGPSHPWQPIVQPVSPCYFRCSPQYCYHQPCWDSSGTQVQSSAPVAMVVQPPLPASFNRPMASSGAYPPNQTPQSQGTISQGPRGPPRKPKQSGHALWVGNLSPNTSIWDMKDHFSKGARDEIESVFLISKTHCGFVNYITEAACASALERFNNLTFQGFRLVCRPRESSNSTSALCVDSASALCVDSASALCVDSASALCVDSASALCVDSASALCVDSASALCVDSASAVKSPVSDAPNIVDRDEQTDDIPNQEEPLCPAKTGKRFFILKSLTVQDLEQCVRDGIWATQPHNEKLLNSAKSLYFSPPTISI